MFRRAVCAIISSIVEPKNEQKFNKFIGILAISGLLVVNTTIGYADSTDKNAKFLDKAGAGIE